MAERLPAAEWTHRPDLAALVAALGAGNAQYVGGAVRDTLLGLAVTDIDMATRLTPEAVMAAGEAAGIPMVPTGIAHGTVTAVLPAGPVEITTLRRDVATDGRHAEVAFTSAWSEDAARRDFTINALYADPATGAISDYFGGLADLRARRVRFIGAARERIAEDHLRILRYFRFAARFGAEDDPENTKADTEAEAACAALAPTLKGLSRERIGQELLKLLALPDPAAAVARMAALGVLREVLPEADPAPLAVLTGRERRDGVAPAPIRRLAALLPPDPRLAEAVAARLRLSAAQRLRLVSAARGQAMREEPRALAYRLGREMAIDALLLAGRSIAPLAGWQVPDFPLIGRDVLAQGVAAGPRVAAVLREVEAQWVGEGFPDEARARALLAAALRP